MRDRSVQIEPWAPLAEGQSRLFTDPVLGEIAQAHAKTIGQVVLRWLIQCDVVVIPKSVRPERIMLSGAALLCALAGLAVALTRGRMAPRF
jgi:2,5-diketo-D-gluconate reductase A